MQGGDISNLSTPRMWVLEDVVLSREEVLVMTVEKKRWWSRKPPEPHTDEAVIVQPAPVSLLWRHAQQWATSGMKVELIHIGDEDREEAIMTILDRGSSSPFSSVISFPTLEAVADHLAYRPDVLNVLDVDDRFMRWGSRGMTLRDLGGRV
jgi:anti-sigma factor ChrR (cupin superfamily)